MAFFSPIQAFENDIREEPAGGGFGLVFNPEDNILGLTAGYGVWITGTPVFGDYFGNAFWSQTEKAFYVGGGMTIRVMPHWRVAPFFGGGGSYNQSLTGEIDDDDLKDRGLSFFGGHAEAGLRVRTGGKWKFVELCARHTWSALRGDHAYWVIAVSLGIEDPYDFDTFD